MRSRTLAATLLLLAASAAAESAPPALISLIRSDAGLRLKIEKNAAFQRYLKPEGSLRVLLENRRREPYTPQATAVLALAARPELLAELDGDLSRPAREDLAELAKGFSKLAADHPETWGRLREQTLAVDHQGTATLEALTAEGSKLFDRTKEVSPLLALEEKPKKRRKKTRESDSD